MVRLASASPAPSATTLVPVITVTLELIRTLLNTRGPEAFATRKRRPPTERRAGTMQASTQTWSYPVGARVMFALLAAFILGMAVFVLALPFLFPSNGIDAATLWVTSVTGFIMLCLGLFLAFGFVAIARTRIAVDGDALVATVTDHHNLFLVPHFREVRIPLAQIRAVERRAEAVKSFGLT